MPARNGAESNHTYKREGIASLTETFRAMGWQIAAFGKVAHGQDGIRHGFHLIERLQNAAIVQQFLDKRDASKRVST